MGTCSSKKQYKKVHPQKIYDIADYHRFMDIYSLATTHGLMIIKEMECHVVDLSLPIHYSNKLIETIIQRCRETKYLGCYKGIYFYPHVYFFEYDIQSTDLVLYIDLERLETGLTFYAI